MNEPAQISQAPLRIAVFQSHPIQHWAPLWQALARRPDVTLKAFYYSRHCVEPTPDNDFGVSFRWDVDLLGGYEHEFLPRQWPTTDPLNSSGTGLNRGFAKALNEGWDAVWISGYAFFNNWRVLQLCRRLGIATLMYSDSNFLSIRKSLPKMAVKHLIVRRFYRDVTVFLALGDHNRDYLRFYGAPPERIRFCPIPVDTARFRTAAALLPKGGKETLRQRFGLKTDDFVIVFSGKFVERKRPLDLAHAVNLLKHPNLAALFIGAGVLEEQLRQAGPRIKLAGFINQREIPQVLSTCDIACMPSDLDPHPLAVTEAQCLGLPVLLSDRCGCYGPHDVFRDGESGLLYQCGNVAQLAEKIAYLAERPEVRKQLGARAVELAETQSPETSAEKLVEAARFGAAWLRERSRAVNA